VSRRKSSSTRWLPTKPVPPVTKTVLFTSEPGSWGRRRYEGAFTEKLTQALAEAKETQAWLDHARAQGYPDNEPHESFDDAWDHVSAMIRRMIQRADRFCDVE